jgi:hypothetical protein
VGIGDEQTAGVDAEGGTRSPLLFIDHQGGGTLAVLDERRIVEGDDTPRQEQDYRQGHEALHGITLNERKESSESHNL